MIKNLRITGNQHKYSRGFTFAELIVGVAVFTVICMSVYNAYISIFDSVYNSRAKITAIDLINEQLEIARNMPYSDVGIVNGVPAGQLNHLQTLVRGGTTFNVTTTVRNTDDPFDGLAGGSPNDTSPADFKIVEVEVGCVTCKNFQPMVVTTRVAPKNLEAASTNGSLFIKVIDADGNPIPDASVHIVNSQINPQIVIDDVTNNQGMLQVIDAPPGFQAYDITVTKSGYSTDQTYKTTVANPNPMKTPATVVLQQVTAVTFAIDRLSTFNVSSVRQTCAPVDDINFNLKGNKLIGTGPDVLKYDQDKKTNGSGTLSIPNLEWDSYSFTLTDDDYELVGMNPISPMNLIPNSSQSVQLVVALKDPKTVLINVKDSATSLPLSGVDVTISKAGFTSVTNTTGQGFLTQTDWSGGDGQATSTDDEEYFSDDGNIETNSPAGELILKKPFGDYAPSGVLESSSFNIGSALNFQKIFWLPIDQLPSIGVPNVRLQVATNNDGGAWNYKGPDGTSGTYYTVGNQNISAVNDGNQFFRYKVFLDTASTTATPNVSDVSFTFTSLCTPPGQVLFNNLNSGTYDLHFSKAGYTDYDTTVDINSSWKMIEVLMSP